MPAPTFFWHDYETFGLSPRRDRPAQFAGVRTDWDLNEIGPPVESFCQLSNDYLPEPAAVLLTGITPQQVAARGVPEPEFVARIHAELATPGTCGAGYNTLRFDDELTRHLFWRNLYPPYDREWRDGGSRWDLIDCVRAAWALRPEGLEWPLREDGAPSFKLEHLSAANGLAHEAAHDALSDVRATIALARRLRTAQPRLFEHCLKLRDKQAVALEIGPFDGRPFLHVSGMFGAQRGCLAVVAALGPHPQNRNEIVVWDLAYDPAELFDLSPNAARARLFTASGSLPDGVKRLPIKTIHLNRSPVVVGNLRALSRERAEVLGIEIDQACRHATVLQARRPDAAWLRALYARDGTAEPHDVDEALYDGFISDADRRRLDTLRAGTPAELAAHTPSFDDPRLEELLFRYRARNWPETLNPSEQARWAVHRAARLEVGTPGWLNATAWWASLEKLRADHTGDAAASATLDALAAWGRTHVPHP